MDMDKLEIITEVKNVQDGGRVKKVGGFNILTVKKKEIGVHSEVDSFKSIHLEEGVVVLISSHGDINVVSDDKKVIWLTNLDELNLLEEAQELGK